LRALCQEFFASPEFRQLAFSTQKVRRGILEALCLSKDQKGYPLGEKPYALMEARHVRALRDAKAATPDAANNLVKAIRGLFAWAMETERVHANPARDIAKLISKNPDGHHSWTEAEIARFEATHPIGTKARLAFAMLFYTGQRRSDIVTLSKDHIADGWIRLTQAKNKLRRPVTIEIPILPELMQIIAATPCAHHGRTLLVNNQGQPFSECGFGNKFRIWCNQANLPHCSAHGLRKARSVIFAEASGTEKELMAWNGWTNPAQASHYTKKANQKKLAGRLAQRLIEQK
jgi:integrase